MSPTLTTVTGGYYLGLEQMDQSVSSRTRSKVQRSLKASQRKEASGRDADDDSRTGRSRRSRTGQRGHHSSLTDDEVTPNVEDDTSDHSEERCKLTLTWTNELDDRYDATFCTQRRADCSDSWKATAGGATTATLRATVQVHQITALFLIVSVITTCKSSATVLYCPGCRQQL